MSLPVLVPVWEQLHAMKACGICFRDCVYFRLKAVLLSHNGIEETDSYYDCRIFQE